MWPHEGVFTADGKPAVYGDLTLTAFIRGYLMVLGMEMDMRVNAFVSQHLEDLMKDTNLNRWIRGDTEHKLQLRRNLVWHAAMLDHTSAPSSAAGARKKAAIPLKVYNAPAAPGTKACEKFNQVKCFSNEDHQDHNICSYRLTAINRAFPPCGSHMQ